MLVMAKCTGRAFDNPTAREFLPGVEYEIDTESQLASLTTVPVLLDDDGNAIRMVPGADGKLKAVRIPKPPYVFEFDRALPGQKIDYTCEQCGEKCKSLNALGTHVRSKHSEAPEPEEPEPEVLADRTCTICGRVCRTPYGMRVHIRKAHPEAAELAESKAQAEVATTA